MSSRSRCRCLTSGTRRRKRRSIFGTSCWGASAGFPEWTPWAWWTTCRSTADRTSPLRLKAGQGKASPGVETRNVLTLSLPMSDKRYKTPEEEINFWNQLLGRIRGLPGVDSVGVVDDLPFNGGSHQPLAIEGRPAQAMSEQPEVDVRIISNGYLHAMHIPL